jgi:hypothetical protein
MALGEGTTEYTVGSIMDRIFVSYLTPPDNQMAQVRLGASIDDTVETILLGGFTIPEDEALLRQGSLLELEEELTRVVSYDRTAGTVLVTRGEYGTVPASHDIPLLMNLNPPYSRAAVFEAVSDNIITLYPSLYTTTEEYLSQVGPGIFPMNDDLSVELLTAWGDSWTSDSDIQGTIVDFHQLTGGRALLLNQASAGSMWVRYRRRMGKAQLETDVLSDLGVDERWVNIVMAGAAADLFMGRDIPAARTEWVQSVLEAESIPVGTRTSIAGQLRRYRAVILNDAMKEMKAEYRTKVRMRNPMKQIV